MNWLLHNLCWACFWLFVGSVFIISISVVRDVDKMISTNFFFALAGAYYFGWLTLHFADKQDKN